MLHRNATVFVAALVTPVTFALAQAPAAPVFNGPKVGDMAPDFTLKGSTKDGAMAKPLHLADYRGQTVVIAFFPKARTKG
jgi:peroxiredoxin Q/BCP